MSITARLTLAAAVFLGGTTLAYAQAADPSPHHPGSPMTPGRPMAPAANAPGMPPMDMAKMMADGMGGKPPMMAGMMGGGGAMMPPGHIEGRIAFLKAELAITDAQAPQWDSYAATMRTNSKGMQDAMAKMMQAGMPTTAPGRADAMIQMMTARLDGMKSSAEADKALYAVLTGSQRKVADDLMPGPMGMM